MNRLQSTFLIILILCGFTSCKERAKRAKAYHDTIAVNTALVVDSVIEYGDAIHSGYKTHSLAATESYLGLIDRTTNKVNQLGAFEGDSIMFSGAINLLSFYNTYISKTFVPYFSSLPNDSLDEFQIEVIDSLHRNMLNEEVPYWGAYNNAEKNFHDKYDLGSVKED